MTFSIKFRVKVRITQYQKMYLAQSIKEDPIALC